MTFTEGPLHERTDVVVETPSPTVLPAPSVTDAPITTAQTRTADASHFAPDAMVAVRRTGRAARSRTAVQIEH